MKELRAKITAEPRNSKWSRGDGGMSWIKKKSKWLLFKRLAGYSPKPGLMEEEGLEEAFAQRASDYIFLQATLINAD